MDNIATYDYETLEAMLRSFLWPLFRISGMLMSMVVFGSFIISKNKRASLAFVLTILVVPVLPEMPNVALLSFEGGLISIQQLVIGLAVGFVSRLVF